LAELGTFNRMQKKSARRQSQFALVALLFFLSSFSTGAQTLPISTVEQIKTDLDAVPCANEKRLDAVRSLFEHAGAPPSDITVDPYKDVENLVVIRKGESSEKIVIGAHYDKVQHGCGAVDNWTGIVALAHLYRTLNDAPLKKTLVFVAFGKEEKGLVGSRAMVKAINKEQLSEYCAMINIDSLGMATPQVGDNMSSKKLGQFTVELAKELQIKFGHRDIPGADSDSSSFIARKIPAVMIHGLANDWATVLHTNYDQSSRVNPAGVYLGYRLVLALIVRLDQSTCEAFR
jgi:putative aminopeptidase FrvX